MKGAVVVLCLTLVAVWGCQDEDCNRQDRGTWDDPVGVLVSTYAPKVWLAVGEKYNPSSVDFHLHNVQVYDGDKIYPSTPSTLPTCSDACYLSTNEPLVKPSATLPFFRGEPIGRTYQPPVYAVVKRISPNVTDIFYWTYYPYNTGKDVCIGFAIWGTCIGYYPNLGNHVGDWEHMAVRVQDGKATNISIAAHGDHVVYSWDATSQTFQNGDDAVQTEGTHPVLFSASGSHGLWSTAGVHTYMTIPVLNTGLQDETSKGTAWDTWNNVPFIEYMPDGGYTGSWTWLNFRGRWGNRKAGCFFIVEWYSGECILNNGPVSINYRSDMEDDELN